jgi:dTDP-4-dehydrorhamnose 3,5-epimerase
LRIDPSVATTDIDGLVVITLKQIGDERGVVREFFRPSGWAELGLPTIDTWKQLNVTESTAGAIRGLHGEDMWKLVTVVAGRAFGAYVDTRAGSSTFGNVVTVDLELGVQVLVPRGVCNGFQSITDTQYLYAFTDEWRPDMPGIAVNPMDPALAIDWPLEPVLSDKDRGLPTFAEATASG